MGAHSAQRPARYRRGIAAGFRCSADVCGTRRLNSPVRRLKVGRGAGYRIAKAGTNSRAPRASTHARGAPRPTRPTQTRWLRAMRALSTLGQECCSRPSVRQSFFPFAQKARPLVRAIDIRLLLSAAERANHAASHGLIWPKRNEMHQGLAPDIELLHFWFVAAIREAFCEALTNCGTMLRLSCGFTGVLCQT